MNKSEKKYYDNVLMEKLHDGEYIHIAYEPIKFNLAHRTTYTPDFMCVTSDGIVEFHEYKGFWRDDARVKWKVAAERFWMFKWLAVTGNGTKKNPYKYEEY